MLVKNGGSIFFSRRKEGFSGFRRLGPILQTEQNAMNLFLSNTVQDIRYALRQLRKSPGFTLTAIITLALGIGATTSIFTLVHAVMLKSLPVTKPDELYRLGNKSHCCNWGGYTQWEEYSIFSDE